MPHCPDCSCTLLSVTKQDIHIDVCPECRGTWFDAGELKAYRVSHPKLPEVSPEAEEDIKSFEKSTGVCPGCRAENFLRAELKKHKVGRCESCKGVWIGDTVKDWDSEAGWELYWLLEIAYWIRMIP